MAPVLVLSCPARARIMPQCRRRAPAVTRCASLAETGDVPVRSGDGKLNAALPAAAGVYAVYSAANELQFVGLSRKLSGSLAAHAADFDATACAAVRFELVQGGSREQLQAKWAEWMQEHVDAGGEVPPGNGGSEPSPTPRPAGPPPARAEIRLTSGKGLADLTVPLATIIKKVVMDLPVVLFIKGTRSAPQCGFSERVVATFRGLDADFDVVDVLDEKHNPGLREAIKAFSDWPTIPQVYIRGEFVGGADIVAELAASGRLADLVKGRRSALDVLK